MGQQLYQPGGGFPIPTQSDTGYQTFIYGSADGPFSIVYDGDDAVTVSSGRLWTSDDSDYDFSGTSFDYYGGTSEIVLQCTVSGGKVTSARLAIGNRTPDFKYRTWSGVEKTAETQTSINAVIATLSSRIINKESSKIVRGKKIIRIFQCVNHDLMIYEACDGLILLPAPFGKP